MARDSIQGFTDQELDYYSRQIMLRDMGLDAQRRLKSSTATIVGLGGLGSPVAMQLTSAGVGKIRLVDCDVVEVSNLQRQHLYTYEDVGLPKAEAAAKRLHKMNPHIELEPIPTLLSPSNADALVEGSNVVVASLDRMSPRYLLNRACIERGVPLIHGAAVAYLGNATTVIPGETGCLECFMGGINDSNLPTCATVGVHTSLVTLVGSVMASECIRVLTGKTPNLANRLLYVDVERLSFQFIQIGRTEGCPVCGKGEALMAEAEAEVEEICGREGRRVFRFKPPAVLRMSLREMASRLEEMGFKPLAQGEMGGTLLHPDGRRVSVFENGLLLVEGVQSLEEAVELRLKVVG